MMTASVPSVTDHSKPDMFRAISFTTLLAGLLDILAAIIKFYLDTNFGAKLKLTPSGEPEPVSFITYLTNGGPDRIFKYIASGVFGKESSISENLLITWGIVFHFMIAFAFTVFLFMIYPKVNSFLKNKYLTALAFGIFTWCIMNLVVVPLSITDKLPSDPKKIIIDATILICMIGLPVALMAAGYYSKKSKQTGRQ